MFVCLNVSDFSLFCFCFGFSRIGGQDSKLTDGNTEGVSAQWLLQVTEREGGSVLSLQSFCFQAGCC